MTEQEWLECNAPRKMLEFLRGKASDRKLRLLACAYVRRIWHLLPEEASRQAVEVCEQYADSAADITQLDDAKVAASWAYSRAGKKAGQSIWDGRPNAARAAALLADRDITSSVVEALDYALDAKGRSCVGWPAPWTERRLQCKLLRDSINLFRSVSLDPAWLTWHGGLLVSMARQMYDSREFSVMPVMADALEEAGCTNQDILDHCRKPGEHVRGCWVVDLILGKE